MWARSWLPRSWIHRDGLRFLIRSASPVCQGDVRHLRWPSIPSGAIAAARRFESALREDMPVRLDPDQRGKTHKRLLAALWVYDQASKAFGALLPRADAYTALADPLLKPSARAASRLRLRLIVRRSSRREALAALQDL